MVSFLITIKTKVRTPMNLSYLSYNTHPCLDSNDILLQGILNFFNIKFLNINLNIKFLPAHPLINWEYFLLDSKCSGTSLSNFLTSNYADGLCNRLHHYLSQIQAGVNVMWSNLKGPRLLAPKRQCQSPELVSAVGARKWRGHIVWVLMLHLPGPRVTEAASNSITPATQDTRCPSTEASRYPAPWAAFGWAFRSTGLLPDHRGPSFFWNCYRTIS